MTNTEKLYIEKLKELNTKQWDLIQTDDSRFIVQSALSTYYGSDEYSPEYRKLANKEDRLYFKSEKLRKSISKLKDDLAFLEKQIEEEKLPEIVCIYGSGRFLEEMHQTEIPDWDCPESESTPDLDCGIYPTEKIWLKRSTINKSDYFEQQIKDEITDSDIEAWAYYQTQSPREWNLLVEGAKAMCDGEIKHIEK